MHNIPVERQWCEVNKLLEASKRELQQLDCLGLCRGGSSFRSIQDPSGRGIDAADIYCVIRTYGERIKVQADSLYAGRRMQRKFKSTKNPNVLAGSYRKYERYNMEASHGSSIPEALAREVGAAARTKCPVTPNAPYIYDPFSSLPPHRQAAALALRDEYVLAEKPMSAKDEYLAFRKVTKQLCGLD